MSSSKEKLLAKKKAELEALEGDILRQNSKAAKKKKLWPKVLGFGVLIFFGIPILYYLSLSPEERVELQARVDAQAEAEEAARQKVINDGKVDALIKKVKRSIETNNYSELVNSLNELKIRAPDKVKKYEGAVPKVKIASAEKDRIRKLNFMGNYYISNYVDEFGDKSGKRFVGYRGSGTFSNSATEGSPLKFWVGMDSPSELDISLYEYGGTNPVKDVFGGDDYVIRFRYLDVTGKVTCKNRGNRISCGSQNSQKIHAALKVAGRVKFSIYNDEYRTSRYSFTMNANGYTNAMRKLAEK